MPWDASSSFPGTPASLSIPVFLFRVQTILEALFQLAKDQEGLFKAQRHKLI